MNALLMRRTAANMREVQDMQEAMHADRFLHFSSTGLTAPDHHLGIALPHIRAFLPTPIIMAADKKTNKPKVSPATHLIAGGIAGFAEACTCHRMYISGISHGC